MILDGLLIVLYWLAIGSFYGAILHLIWSFSPHHGAIILTAFLFQKALKLTVLDRLLNKVNKMKEESEENGK